MIPSRRYRWLIMLCLLLPASTHFLHAQTAEEEQETDSLVLRNLDWWQDLKFGFMMHWGPYSQWGIVESWSICPEDVDWAPRRFPTYQEHCEKYEQLPRSFNPVRFDPAAWARIAKKAGMKYLVFTTKHHDGFCMFDTRQTDYRITHHSCAFSADPRANITRELFDAFRMEGFGIGAYFSKPDWHSPYYWAPEFGRGDRNVNYVIQRHPDKWKKFCDYTFNQIEELTTGYGRLDILWLDGGWVRPLREEDFRAARPVQGFQYALQSQDINMPRIAAMARGHQPGLIIVDRTVTGRYENYRTPEQEVPATPPGYLWETCMTMANQWSYLPGDRYKPTNQLIHLLVDIVAKGGNFLLNVGPDPNGELPDTALARMKEIGDWMKVNGEAIYKTRPIAPYKEGKICFTSLKDGARFAVYLADEGELSIPAQVRIASLEIREGESISLLGDGRKLDWLKEQGVTVISVPDEIRHHPPCLHAWTFKITKG